MRSSILISLTFLTVLAIGSNAFAAFIDFQTPAGATSDGEFVHADLQITTSKSQITVLLTNLQSDTHSLWQEVSGIEFTLSNGPHLASLTSSSTIDRTVHQNGTWSDASSGTPTGWSMSNLLSNQEIQLKSPGDMKYIKYSLIGSPNPANNRYTTQEGIWMGPQASFTLSCTGVTANTIVTGAIFNFGKTTEIAGVGGGFATVPLPEPASLSLLSLTAIPLLGRRRPRKLA